MGSNPIGGASTIRFMFPLASSVAEVIDILDDIIDWSVDNVHPIGCFAVLHRRTDVLIQEALDRGGFFENPEGIDRLATVFANTYIDLMNGLIRGEFPSAWKLALNPDNTLLQSLVLPINAHVLYDLGIAIAQFAREGGDLKAVRRDFDLISDIDHPSWGMYGPVAQQGSPDVRLLRPFVPNRLFEWMLTRARGKTWRFAENLLEHPGDATAIRMAQVDYTRKMARRWWVILLPLARAQSRDVVANIKMFREAQPDWTPDIPKWFGWFCWITAPLVRKGRMGI